MKFDVTDLPLVSEAQFRPGDVCLADAERVFLVLEATPTHHTWMGLDGSYPAGAFRSGSTKERYPCIARMS